MSYRVALNFEDGTTRFIEVNDGEKVLDAAYRYKINLPMDCSDGVCGTCKCRCEAGQYELGDDYLEEALTADEAARGMVLTCQMILSSDCMIAVPMSSAACKIKPLPREGNIAEVKKLSSSTILLTLALDEPVDFLAGQYVQLAIPGTTESRAYSFSTKPGRKEAGFLIRNVPGGRMSGWLTGQAKPGGKMSFTGPAGSFYLRPVERPMLMLAGGTGLAPLLSMLEVLAETGSSQPVHLIYGVTRDEDLVETERLDGLAAKLPCFSWTSCIADPASTHSRKGYVTDHLASTPVETGDCDVYLCGPPPMVEAVRQAFAARGFSPSRFLYEKFTVSVPA
jgi:benzoate/toluate 1,2-dioxygenase reductase subunit